MEHETNKIIYESIRYRYINTMKEELGLSISHIYVTRNS